MSYISDVTEFVTQKGNWSVAKSPSAAGRFFFGRKPTLTAARQFPFSILGRADNNRELFCEVRTLASRARILKKENPTADIRDPDSLTGRDKVKEFVGIFKQLARQAGVNPECVEFAINDDDRLPGTIVKVTIPEQDLKRVRRHLAADGSGLGQLAL